MPIHVDEWWELECDLCGLQDTVQNGTAADLENDGWLLKLTLPDLRRHGGVQRTKFAVICPACAEQIAAAVALCVPEDRRQSWVARRIEIPAYER